MKTRQERIDQAIKELDRLFENEHWHYRLGYLQGWLARLIADDITIRQELERRIAAKINDRNQKGNGRGQRGPRAPS